MNWKPKLPVLVIGCVVLTLLVVIAAIIVVLRLNNPPVSTSTNPPVTTDPTLGESLLQPPAAQTLEIPDAYKTGVFGSPRTMTLPANLHMSVFADGMNTPRFFTFDDQDRMYVAEAGAGRVVMIADDNHDGVGDSVQAVDTGLDFPNSVFFYKGDLYVGETNEIIVYRGISDGKYTSKAVLVPNLPTDGHVTRTVIIGPDNMMYVSIGSSCNLCQETDNRRAAVVRYKLDGTLDKVFASGLRNSVGIIFHQNAQGVDELWSVDNGRDNLGDDLPPEEVNILQEGKNYGWPYCYGSGHANPEYASYADYCQTQTAFPKYEMQAHSAPLDLAFGPNLSAGNFPQGLKDNLFISFHGSWNRSVPTGYKVVRINTAKPDATPIDFITGFVDSSSNVWGRPVGVAFDSKGVMYISDDKAGAIYRVTYNQTTTAN